VPGVPVVDSAADPVLAGPHLMGKFRRSVDL
jgi:hypothetical protein